MLRRVICCGLLLVSVTVWDGISTALATPPFSLIPFKRVEADPDQSYDLTTDHGPWMILASSFAGPGAEQQAQELVLELRSRYKLPAYVFRKAYDFTEPLVGKGLNEYGGAKIMKHRQAVQFKEIAVLVGDYRSVDEPALEQALQKIKHARPECLDIRKHKDSTQRFVGLRSWQRAIKKLGREGSKGPMGNAFVTRNPLLPEEYFTAGGLDDFIIDMNRGVKYSLLDNPAAYSVRVATFRGHTQLERRPGDSQARPSNKLAEAAEKAHVLTMALREQGIEAYEFHDRNESIVTVGSFDSVGQPRADGKTEINPAIHQVMQIYAARVQPLPGQEKNGLQPRRLNGITFDLQPIPVQVPRRSLGADYARGFGR